VIIYLRTYACLCVEEISNLKITDLNLELKRIRIVDKIMKVVPISEDFISRTRGLVEVSSGNGQKKKLYVAASPYVFYSQRSLKFLLRGMQRMIESYILPNKKLTLHMFRHTFCKWMLKATNNDIEKVRRLAGHSNIATTSRYSSFVKSTISFLRSLVSSLFIRFFYIAIYYLKLCSK
jgi:site-specific recombinase XerD